MLLGKLHYLKNSFGFTLLELLLVLAIIGFASALLIPKLNSDVKFYDAQVRELIAILKYNRRMAVVTNQVQQVTLHPYAEDKAINNAIETQILQSKQSNKKNHWYSKGVKYIWKTGVVNNKLINKSVSIDFFPQGGATQGQLLVSFVKLKNIIQVDGFTGKITLIEALQNDF